MGTISLIVGTYVSGTNAIKTNGSTGAQSDTLDLRYPAIGLHCSAAGTVALLDGDGNSATFTVTAGSFYPYRIRRVLDTGTSLADADMVLLYGPGGK